MEGDCNVYAHSSLWMSPTGEWSINAKMVYRPKGPFILHRNCVAVLIYIDYFRLQVTAVSLPFKLKWKWLSCDTAMQLHCKFCAGRCSSATQRNFGVVWTDLKLESWQRSLWNTGVSRRTWHQKDFQLISPIHVLVFELIAWRWKSLAVSQLSINDVVNKIRKKSHRLCPFLIWAGAGLSYLSCVLM